MAIGRTQIQLGVRKREGTLKSGAGYMSLRVPKKSKSEIAGQKVSIVNLKRSPGEIGTNSPPTIISQTNSTKGGLNNKKERITTSYEPKRMKTEKGNNRYQRVRSKR